MFQFGFWSMAFLSFYTCKSLLCSFSSVFQRWNLNRSLMLQKQVMDNGSLYLFFLFHIWIMAFFSVINMDSGYQKKSLFCLLIEGFQSLLALLLQVRASLLGSGSWSLHLRSVTRIMYCTSMLRVESFELKGLFYSTRFIFFYCSITFKYI